MNEVLEQLKRHEGFSSTAYRCPTGKITVGYGRNLDDVGVSKAEALDLLYTDVRRATRTLKLRIPVACQLDEARLAVLVNMTFNMGIGQVSKFTRMLAAIKKGDWNEASKEMLDSKWAIQVGQRAQELSLQMRTGEFHVPN